MRPASQKSVLWTVEMKLLALNTVQQAVRAEAGRNRACRAEAARRRAFTLLEVMIAIAILFVGTFAILDLISSSLENARRLQRPLVDASSVLAFYAATNKLVEGTYYGNLGDPEFLGKKYRDYNWTAQITEVGSNHLYEVECTVEPMNDSHKVLSDLATLLYKPDSPPGSLDGGIGVPGR